MKGKWMIIPALLLVLAGMVMVGCGGGGGDTYYTVTFDKNCTVEVTGMPSDQKVVENGKITAPTTTPTRTDGYVFDRWDKTAGGTAWDFANDPVTKDTILYAKWNRAIGGNLGPMTVENNATQRGWATNGTDDITTNLTVETLINAQYLKLVLEKKPVGGMQIVWQGDGSAPGVDAWNWNETAISNNTGDFDAAKGAVWDEATKTLTIELSKAFAGYAALANSYKAKFFICYYSTNVDSLGIISADLIANTTNPIEFVFITFDANGGEWDIGTATEPELVSERVVRLVKGESMGDKFPANPLKEGFHLDKWVDSSDVEYTASTPITADVTLTAVWATGEAQKWTVTFNTDGGTPTTIAPITDISDGTAIGPTNFPANPTKAGNIFAGWFDSDNVEYTSSKAITGNTDLKAKWTAIVYPPQTPMATYVPEKDASNNDKYIKGPELTVDGGTSLADWAAGKGDIKGDDLTKIKAATDGVIVVYGLMTSSDKNGWGGGRIGDHDGVDGAVINNGSGTAGEAFAAAVKISAIPDLAAATKVNVNAWDFKVQKLELWTLNPDYVAPVGLTLYENGTFKGGFELANATYDSGDKRQDIELPSGAIDVTAYTKIYIQLKDDFDPNGYFAGGVGGFPADSWDWIDEANYSGWDLAGKTASMSLGSVKKLAKILFKGNNEPKIENVVKIWLE